MPCLLASGRGRGRRGSKVREGKEEEGLVGFVGLWCVCVIVFVVVVVVVMRDGGVFVIPRRGLVGVVVREVSLVGVLQ